MDDRAKVKIDGVKTASKEAGGGLPPLPRQGVLMPDLFSLENEADVSRRNEQGARSKAECKKPKSMQDDSIINSRLVQEIIKLGAEIVSIENLPPKSPGLDNTTVNEDKAKVGHFSREWRFKDYRQSLAEKRVLVANLNESSVIKVVKPAEASRYFDGGRKRIKAKIRKRLGRWYNCPGLLLSLTFDPKLITCDDAWRQVGLLRREFMNRVNRWRRRQGYQKAKFLSVLELQKQTGYPHIHLVFPYLRFLAPVSWLVEQWGQAPNSVDVKVRGSISPVSYVCKYITKLDGWSDEALAQIWDNGTRLYSMSRDYYLPDYSDKRVPEWCFKCTMSLAHLTMALPSLMEEYNTMLGVEDVVQIILDKEAFIDV
jgi:hypothetical protein